ncbi:MAG: ABC transporter permease [Firmicutes bacterium]|nr:ABC transporter permease [Bacillota bacterium]
MPLTLLEIALLSITRRGGRFALAVFGLALGVMAAVALFSLSGIMVAELGNRLDEFGANILVLPQTGTLNLTYGGVTLPGVTYEVKDFEMAVLDKIGHIPDAASIRVTSPKLLGVVDSTRGQKVPLAGVDFDRESRLKAWWQVQGRLPEGEEEILPGHAVAAALGLRVGDSLTLGDRKMTVTGILEETGSPDDGLVFAQLPLVQEILGRPGRLSLIEVSAYCNTCPIEQMVGEISAVLPDARVTALKQAVQARMETAKRFQSFSWLLSGLMLLVGSLMVINTLLISIRERTKEIGVLRAIGFRRRQIATIILVEALAIGLAGGGLGCLLGMVAVLALRPMVGSGSGAQFFPWWLIPASLGTAALLAVLAASYPARRAADLDPAEVLRGQ